jgi:hypothetical protein
MKLPSAYRTSPRRVIDEIYEYLDCEYLGDTTHETVKAVVGGLHNVNPKFDPGRKLLRDIVANFRKGKIRVIAEWTGTRGYSPSHFTRIILEVEKKRKKRIFTAAEWPPPNGAKY